MALVACVGWLPGNSGKDSRARDQASKHLVPQTCRKAHTPGLLDNHYRNTTYSAYLSKAVRKAELDLVDQSDPDNGNRVGALCAQHVRNRQSARVDSHREEGPASHLR